MALDLTIGELIKLILGALVVVLVVSALGFFFKERVLDFFKSLKGGAAFLPLIL